MASSTPSTLHIRAARLLATAAAALRLPPASNLGAALKTAETAFEAHSVPEPRLSAEHLLAAAAGFGSDRAALAAASSQPLAENEREAFEAMCARRLTREPVQYILGSWDFHRLTLALRPPVLIPRPETEELVELVLGCAYADADAAPRLLDVGCGSGAIGLALLDARRSATCVGVDLSADAVALAAQNAAACGLAERYAAELVPGGIAAYGGGGGGGGGGGFDVIVSNPPYIPRADMASLEREVVGFEDERALCGGDDGLDVVRQLLEAAPALLRPDGPRAIWLEVDASHPPLIEGWVREARPELRMRLLRTVEDLAGKPRFCELRWGGVGDG